jgi:hypothetical protein
MKQTEPTNSSYTDHIYAYIEAVNLATMCAKDREWEDCQRYHQRAAHEAKLLFLEWQQHEATVKPRDVQ